MVMMGRGGSCCLSSARVRYSTGTDTALGYKGLRGLFVTVPARIVLLMSAQAFVFVSISWAVRCQDYVLDANSSG